ncbi:MAG TPA: N-(5'-phosphoribosyl)anthranilate isomerase [Roseibacterium sp.]|nr:N-(5'-phosphoribosyl)anthranilate isomerase [Roseicyclus sp.]HID67779.1 N-(5'-phosphoribosyl)anthranilate isomerase [Roseibacterium sp.]
MKHDAIPPSDPDAWIEQAFDNPGVRNGGIFRTSVQAVETGVGMERFISEVQRRQFRALENAGHIVVFCNQMPVAILSSTSGPSVD